MQRFKVFAAANGWSPRSDIYKEQRKIFITEAVRQSFRRNFGTDASSLAAWRAICIVVNVGVDVTTLPTVAACKQVCRFNLWIFTERISNIEIIDSRGSLC